MCRSGDRGAQEVQLWARKRCPTDCLHIWSTTRHITLSHKCVVCAVLLWTKTKQNCAGSHQRHFLLGVFKEIIIAYVYAVLEWYIQLRLTIIMSSQCLNLRSLILLTHKNVFKIFNCIVFILDLTLCSSVMSDASFLGSQSKNSIEYPSEISKRSILL